MMSMRAQIYKYQPILCQNSDIQQIIIGNKVMIDQHIYQEQIMKTLDALQEIVGKMDFNVSILEKLTSQKLALKGWVNPHKDPRFSVLDYPLTLTRETKNKDDVTVWCGLMAKEVFEHAFMLFQKGDLDEDEVKCLATSNFLHNFLRLSQRVNLQREEIKEIDTKLKKQILPYLLKKYPQSKSKEVNIKLSQKINKKKIDNIESNQNDLIWKSKEKGVKFELSQSKQYDQSIMEFLNYVISISNSEGRMKQIQEQYYKKKQNKTDRKGKESEATLYQDFHEYFQKIFEKIYKKQGEKQNVKQYTKYSINRKISPNTEKFSEQELREGNLTLKNSALMRVVTKWCEELRNNFKNAHTIAHKHGQFRMIDGSQRYLSRKQAEHLEIILERKNELIKKWLEKVREDNLLHQQQFAQKKNTDPKDKMLSEHESSVGMFAAVNNQNYEFYLICYLKELIHQCLSAMEEFECLCYLSDRQSAQITKSNMHYYVKKGRKYKQQKQNKEKTNSQVISLITFKIGDLLRCKCSSKQQEVNYLYNELHRISEERPDILKIVRIKNRLYQGTKDFLLNLLFEGNILVEIQLAIDTGKNKFMECSDKFNHFIYEVKRAEFGPISELCSIWMNKDLRADFFRERFSQTYQGNQEQENQEYNQQQENQEQDNQKQIAFPFLCPCGHYGINPHQISNSLKKQCINCILKKQQYQKYKKIKQINETFKKLPDVQADKTEVQRIKYIKSKQFQFPTQGLVLNLKTREKKCYFFKCFCRGKKKYLIKEENKKFICIGEVTNKKQQKLFLQNNLVFYHPQFKEKANRIKGSQVQKYYFIPQTFKTMEGEQKQSIRIMGEGLTDEQIGKESFDFVKSANLSENNFESLNSIVKKFPKAKKLILNNSKFLHLDIEKNFAELQEFSLNDSHIQTISENTFKNIKGVEILSLRDNKINNLPSSFKKLANLKSLYLSSNGLTSLPSLDKFSKLQNLHLYRNKLISLPSLDKLVNLQNLNLSYTQLISLPSLEKLENLQNLDASSNQLTFVPSLKKLVNLQNLNLSNNNLASLPSLEQLTNLQNLDLSSNKLTQLPPLDKLVKLQNLYVSSNHLTSLASLDNLANLQDLDASSNQLTSLPSFDTLVNLLNLNLQSNHLISLPPLDKLVNLQDLSLRKNKLTSLPSLKQLINLQNLSLNHNKLTSLPSLKKLANLQNLNLSSNNKLTSLPPLDKLTNLKNLNLSSTALTSLPSVDKLANLQYLNLSSTILTSLPSLDKLANLQNLHYSRQTFSLRSSDWENHRQIQIIEHLASRGIKVSKIQ